MRIGLLLWLSVWGATCGDPSADQTPRTRAATRVLFCDRLFPSAYAKWRIEETRAFLEAYDTDVLVPHRISAFRSHIFPVQFNETRHLFPHDSYDLLIFDPEFNWLQPAVNGADFNGTAFNRQLPFSYLLRKKTRRGAALNFWGYDAYFYIFQSTFNRVYTALQQQTLRIPQVLHLYPGGGLNPSLLCPAPGSRSRKNVHLGRGPKVFITTQLWVQQDAQQRCQRFSTVRVVHIYLGTYMPRDPAQTLSCRLRTYSHSPSEAFGVAISSVGEDHKKGVGTFRALMQQCANLFPEAKVHWFVLGQRANSSEPVKDSGGHPTKHVLQKLQVMPQERLDEFYMRNVHVYVNAETGGNGWPLGAEAAMTGAVLFSTDVSNVSAACGFQSLSVSAVGDVVNADTANFVSLGTHSVPQTAVLLRHLYQNRTLFEGLSRRSQGRVCEAVAYSAQQDRIFAELDKAVATARQ